MVRHTPPVPVPAVRALQRRLATLAATVALGLGAWSLPAQADGPKRPPGPIALPAPINVHGFATPESVLHDTERDVYLVSNINGGGLAKDNNGFISRVSPEGVVLQLKWIEGGVNGVSLDAPKGSVISGDTLYVADIDQLRLFDAATGAPRGSIAFPGATFLNDVTADDKGTVYVSDSGFQLNAAGTGLEPSGTDAVYRVGRGGRVGVLARGTALNHPNGLDVLNGGRLQVVVYDPFGGTREIYTLDRQGRRGKVQPMPAGLLDGVVVLRDGDLLVSSWETSTVYRVDDGRAVAVATNLPNPADIGYDRRRQRVLVPLFDANTVVIQPLGRVRP